MSITGSICCDSKNKWLGELKVRFLVLIGFTLVSVVGHADCNGGACSNITIEEMQVQSDGRIFVQTSGDETALNCTPEANVFLRLDGSTEGGKNIYSALLTSHTQDEALNIRIIDNQNPCQITHVTVK